MDQTLLNIVFFVVAVLVVLILVGVQRYWTSKVNLSEEDEDLERRLSSLNEHQANKRRDDEIVRLLRGDEQPIIGQRED